MTLSSVTLTDAGLDAVALKPAEMDLRRARELSADTLAIDYEGREHVLDGGYWLSAAHSTSLDAEERRRAIALRLRAVVDSAADPWVGTEGLVRIALAVGVYAASRPPVGAALPDGTPTDSSATGEHRETLLAAACTLLSGVPILPANKSTDSTTLVSIPSSDAQPADSTGSSIE